MTHIERRNIMADFLLGLDYGTGGAKACVINPAGEVLGSAFEEYPFFHEKPGWSEHDAVLYWTIACRMIQDCIAQARINPAEIRGIAVSSALPSMVMVDRDHNPIHRAYNLMDRRAIKEVAWLKENIGEARIQKLTGNRIEDHPSLVNLLWEKNNRPDSFKRIFKALTIDGFITLKLTGKAVANYGAAPFYGVAYDLVNECFDDQMLAEIDIDPGLIPDLGRCEEIIGEVTSAAAADTGLVPGIPVVVGQVDFNASCIAAGVTEEGDIMSNLGTVGNFGVIHKSKAFNFSPVGLAMINLAFTIDSANTYITIPSTTTGGQSIRYLRDNFSQYEIETERALGVSSYDLLNLQAQKIPVGSDGLIILPFLMGERTPIWDPVARGVIFGLSLNHTKGHVIRAMMEAVAYALYDSYRLIIESGLTINYPVIFHEGGTVSNLWRQIITDVFNVPTVLVTRRTGAPMGDAILAGVATGIFNDFSVAKAWAEYSVPVEPIPENHERYMEYFALYKQIYEHVKDDFKTLAQLRDRP
jgi:xylulokinase